MPSTPSRGKQVLGNDNLPLEGLRDFAAPGRIGYAMRGRQMREYQRLDADLLGNAANGVDARMLVGDMRHQCIERNRLLAPNLGPQTGLHRRNIHGLVHQHVSALGQLRHDLERRDVTRKRNRAIMEIEAVPQRRFHRRVIDDDRRDLDILILHHGTGGGDLAHIEAVQRFALRPV